jgi:hypothetical protein
MKRKTLRRGARDDTGRFVPHGSAVRGFAQIFLMCKQASHPDKAQAPGGGSCYSKEVRGSLDIGWRKGSQQGSEDREARGKTQGADLLVFSRCFRAVKQRRQELCALPCAVPGKDVSRP